VKYNPRTEQWTLFKLPARGSDFRHISLLERNGQPLRVIIPCERGAALSPCLHSLLLGKTNSTKTA